MSLARYFLLEASGNWLITLEGRVMGAYASRTEAVESAIVMADLMGAMHHESDVMIETVPGQALELIWTYGRDKLPKAIAKRKKAAAEVPPRHVRQVQRGEAA